ncbi:MAG: succinate dehydrogenase assembly factor 2 [Candelina mexicana]|nr:MAG: succinate dehydrogenase assembly factor 2 [Candelina mexicana]
MSSLRTIFRSAKPALRLTRPLSMITPRYAPERQEGQDEWRKIQKEKSTGPHLPNTTSTISNEMPSVGADKAPPELLTSVDPDFIPKDSVPKNTEHLTGGTQPGSPDSGANAELGVGEMEGGEFKVEPLRRTGEDANTMRARLLLDQSRKRGTLESDLLLSTFADTHLSHLTTPQLQQYDLFLDENDWDIYYWATQEPTPTSLEYAEGGSSDQASPPAQGKDASKPPTDAKASTSSETDAWRNGAPRSGEWAQTVGTVKPAYRPVPQRWRNSEILAMLRKHVIERSAGGVHEGDALGGPKVEGEGLARGVKGTGGGGLGRMPEVKNFDV